METGWASQPAPLISRLLLARGRPNGQVHRQGRRKGPLAPAPAARAPTGWAGVCGQRHALTRGLSGRRSRGQLQVPLSRAAAPPLPRATPPHPLSPPLPRRWPRRIALPTPHAAAATAKASGGWGGRGVETAVHAAVAGCGQVAMRAGGL